MNKKEAFVPGRASCDKDKELDGTSKEPFTKGQESSAEVEELLSN